MKIAIVGSGISGLGAAHLLVRAHDVTLFERDSRAGGHTHTIEHKGQALDTGFLVHNTRNYPLLVRLFGELGVKTQSSEMSFSVSCDGCGLEYSGRRPFAQRRNAVSARFGALAWEIARWLRTARRSLDEVDYERHSLDAYLDERGYSQRFRRHFLVPLTSALWSTAPGRALEFPAAYAIRFFDNHGMLGFGRFRWRTVTGGSHSYVRAIGERLGPRLKLGLGVRSLARNPDGVALTTDDGERHRFDEVVVATHADQALALLEDPSEAESRVLGAFPYTKNDAVLHTDASLLPRTRGARASWNYRLRDDGLPTVTYYLNRLQGIDDPTDFCVTLNEDVAEEHVIRRMVYDHPLYTVESFAAQRALPSLSGFRHTHYVGAHHGNGFHEDGLASGVRAAAALGVTW
ncbi:MAG: FAD-dependent oxidoreductase [Actinomycetota bacterium]|nr:FAD-dependent oxidoreductase [Actinomycetota bacterium]